MTWGGGQRAAGGDDGFARGQAVFVFGAGPQQATFLKNGRAASAVNGASNAALAEQAGADGIYDGRRLLPGDAAPHKLNTG